MKLRGPALPGGGEALGAAPERSSTFERSDRKNQHAEPSSDSDGENEAEPVKAKAPTSRFEKLRRRKYQGGGPL
jgi:hypothetical protein